VPYLGSAGRRSTCGSGTAELAIKSGKLSTEVRMCYRSGTDGPCY